MQPDLIVVGTVTYRTEPGKHATVKHALLIACDTADQVRQALKQGRIDFTIFGQPAEESREEEGELT